MTYIPVGTILTYNAQISVDYVLQSLDTIISTLANQLHSELPGYEEFDVLESANHQAVFGQSSITLKVLNNGVDHSDENDIASIISGQLQSMGVEVVSSSISSIQLPNNPGEKPEILQTGATQQVALPTTVTPSKSSTATSLFSLGTTGTITTGFVIIIIAIVALIFLLPTGFARSLRAVRS